MASTIPSDPSSASGASRRSVAKAAALGIAAAALSLGQAPRADAEGASRALNTAGPGLRPFVWGEEVSKNSAFSVATAHPNGDWFPAATPLTLLPGGRGGVVSITGDRLALMEDGTLWYCGPNTGGFPAIVVPGPALPGERMVKVTLGDYVLTSAGRVFQVVDPAVTRLVPTPGPIVDIRGSQYTNPYNFSANVPLLTLLTADGRVLHQIADAPPVPMVDITGTPISGIVQIAGKESGGMALVGGSGKVYIWGRDVVGSYGCYLGGAMARETVAGFVQDAHGGDLSGITRLVQNSALFGQGGAFTGTDLYTWGPGFYFKHHPNIYDQPVPAAVRNGVAAALVAATGAPIVDASTTISAMSVILADGSAWSWGLNASGSFGDGNHDGTYGTPVPARILTVSGTPLVASRFVAATGYSLQMAA